MFELHPYLVEQAITAYVVGGSIRDLLAGRLPGDYDIAVVEHPEVYAAGLADRLNGRMVRLGRRTHLLYRVIAREGTFDVVPVQGGRIEADLAGRDFTINAMAWDLARRRLIDPFGGQNDMDRGCLRMVGPGVFDADPVRLIRAYRIASQLGFRVDPSTEKRIADRSSLIRSSAGERISDELLALLETDSADRHVTAMAGNGLLFAIIPELEALRQCRHPGRGHDSGDAFDHSLRALTHLKGLVSMKSRLLEGVRRFPLSDYPPRKAALTRLATLLHDIGKPATETVTGDGRHRYPGHDRIGAQICSDVGTRLRMSGADTAFVAALVRHHMRLLHMWIAHHRHRLTQRAVSRFFIQHEHHWPALCVCWLADMAAKAASPAGSEPAPSAFINGLCDQYAGQYRRRLSHPPLITGHDLISELHLAPSPQFRLILSTIRREQIAGRLRTRDDALHRAVEISASAGGAST